MSEFWVQVIVQDAPWERFDVDATFQAERVRRQDIAAAMIERIPPAVRGGDLDDVLVNFTPLVIARRDMDDAQYLEFIAFEYITMQTTNIALQHVPTWRQATDDREGWTQVDLDEFYAVHDAQAALKFSQYKKTADWDEIAAKHLMTLGKTSAPVKNQGLKGPPKERAMGFFDKLFGNRPPTGGLSAAEREKMERWADEVSSIHSVSSPDSDKLLFEDTCRRLILLIDSVGRRQAEKQMRYYGNLLSRKLPQLSEGMKKFLTDPGMVKFEAEGR